MPYSFSTFDDYIYEFICDKEPFSVLDVGPGIGKIGSMVSKAARDRKFETLIEAYEIFEPYIRKYELKWIYDVIYNENIMEIMKKDNLLYDIIFFGDSLEHLTKEDGLKLIKFLLPNCNWIVIKTPNNMPQGPVYNNPYETHLSSWNLGDFFENVYDFKMEERPDKQFPERIITMNLFILEGTGDSEIE